MLDGERRAAPRGQRTEGLPGGTDQPSGVPTGGDADRVVGAARETFGALARWCSAPADVVPA